MLATSWLVEPPARPPPALPFDPLVPTGEPVLKAVGLAVPGRLSTVDIEVGGGRACASSTAPS
jgi:hypothetical protein